MRMSELLFNNTRSNLVAATCIKYSLDVMLGFIVWVRNLRYFRTLYDCGRVSPDVTTITLLSPKFERI